jgi:hypothetical protein
MTKNILAADIFNEHINDPTSLLNATAIIQFKQ